MRKGSKAFTLIEVLLASALLVFTLPVILMLFANCIFLNASNRALTIATSHAQGVMEEIKDTKFSAIETNINNGSWNWNISNNIEGRVLTVLPGETIDTYFIGSGSSVLLNVRTTVEWKERGQRSRSISLETLFGEL